MKVKLKKSLKNTFLYRRFQKPFSHFHSWILLIAKKKKFYWMKKQSLMVDPCTGSRQKYWIKCGAKINGQINIGYDVYFDASNANLITIDEGAWITSRCLLLCHKRDMAKYFYGMDINQIPYDKAPIHIGKGVHLGMGTIVMPGVTIGEGSIIGAGAVVTKDIPAWSLAVGVPAKVVKSIPRQCHE